MKFSFRRFIFALLATLLLYSCSPGVNDESYHLPQKTMEQLLLDINVAEGYSIIVRDSLHLAPGTKNVDSLAIYYKEIFAHYHITEAEFKQSLSWYKNHPEELDSMYNNNIEKVAAWQAHQFNKILLPKTDSVSSRNYTITRDSAIKRMRAIHNRK